MKLVISGYETATLDLEWKPNQYGWFISVAWQDFSVSNVRLTCMPNILRQWKKILPFGLSCQSTNKVEPVTDTALTDYCKLYLLDASDVLAAEQLFYGE